MTFTIGGRPFVMPAHVLNKGPVKYEADSCFSAVATAEKYAGEILLNRIEILFPC
jgi:hypothetical protein